MVKFKNSKDKEGMEIVSKEIEKFKNLIKWHEKLLVAIGKL